MKPFALTRKYTKSTVLCPVIVFLAIASATVEAAPTLGLFGGAGLPISITKSAIENFPYTKFKGGLGFAGGLNVCFMPRGRPASEGFCLRLAVHAYRMGLDEFGLSYGTVNTVVFIASPGVMFIRRKPGGLGAFFTLMGLGFAQHTFDKGYLLESAEEEYDMTYTVEMSNSFVFALFPFDLEVFLARRPSMGLHFPGFVVMNMGTSWSLDGEPIPEIETMHLSHIQILGAVTLWL